MSDPYRDLGVRLTAEARRVTESLTADERTAIRRYQALDRTYELVAGVLRGQLTPDELAADTAELVSGIIDALIPATNRWRLPEPVRLYRGQRSASAAVGAGARVGSVLVAETFVSTTIYKQVAFDEFTRPPGPSGPALLEMHAPAGTPGLWLPPAGDPDLAYQGELLLPRETRIAIRGERVEAGILLLDCEVLP